MKKQLNYQYYVEGEDEKCLLNTLKTDLRCIQPGKVDKFNAVQSRFTDARIRTLKPNTIIILVYDTDVDFTEILRYNIAFLNQKSAIKQVFCIPQVNALENELLRSCQIKTIQELTHSSSKANYKRDLINCTNLAARLKCCNFDISKMWTQIPLNSFFEFGNDASKIKL